MTSLPDTAGPVAGSEALSRHMAYRAVRRFGSLDGLRFLCIAAVLWHHSPLLDLANPPFLLAARGFVGVDFFFVLSGFLITTLLLREEATSGRFSLSGFYWRRALRILPVYYLIVTLIGAYYILGKGEHQYLELLPFYYLFLSNFLTSDIPMLSPTWSLAVEEQYYLVWPLLLMCLPRRAVLPVLVVLIMINVLGGAGAFAAWGIHPINAGVLHIALPNSTYAPILIGSVVAILMHSPPGFSVFWRLLGHPLAPLVAFPALLTLLIALPEDLRGWPNLVMHLTMAACLISITIREDHVLRPVLSWRPAARVGEISYGIYLYHLLALHVATVALAGHSLAIFVIYLLVSVLMAEISFRTYERLFLSYRHRRSAALDSKKNRNPAR